MASQTDTGARRTTPIVHRTRMLSPVRPLRGGLLPRQFALGYAAFLGGILGLGYMLGMTVGLDVMRAVLAVAAVVFAIAAFGRPRVVYLVVRNIGAARWIANDRAVRVLFVAHAVILALLATRVPHGILRRPGEQHTPREVTAEPAGPVVPPPARAS